jgi:hypothetical protein
VYGVAYGLPQAKVAKIIKNRTNRTNLTFINPLPLLKLAVCLSRLSRFIPYVLGFDLLDSLPYQPITDPSACPYQFSIPHLSRTNIV